MVGIDIDKTTAKLEKENGFLIRRRVELQDLEQAWIDKRAAKLEKENRFLTRRQVNLLDLKVANKGLQRNQTPSRRSEPGCDLSRYNARRLAMAVLGEEGSLEKPKNVKWLDPYWWRLGLLSNDMVKYATAEAYLVYEIGSKLLHKFS